MKMRILRAVMAVLILAVAASCSLQKQEQRLRDGLKIERVNGIEPHGLDSVVVGVSVRNDTGYKPVLKAGSAEVMLKGRRVATVTLLQPVQVPAKAVTPLNVPVRLEIGNPFEALALWSRWQNKNYDDITLNFTMTVRVSVVEKQLHRENVPLKELVTMAGGSL